MQKLIFFSIFSFIISNCIVHSQENKQYEINGMRASMRAHLMQYQLDPSHFDNVIFVNYKNGTFVFVDPLKKLRIDQAEKYNVNNPPTIYARDLLQNNFVIYHQNIEKKKFFKKRIIYQTVIILGTNDTYVRQLYQNSTLANNKK